MHSAQGPGFRLCHVGISFVFLNVKLLSLSFLKICEFLDIVKMLNKDIIV